MSTIVLVGSSSTRRFEHAGRTWVYTPRRHGL
jgi:precorrin-3B methylase